MSTRKHAARLSKSRRQFLHGAVTASLGATAAALAPKSVAAIIDDDNQHEVNQNKGYRLTQHIVDYYRGASR